MNTTVTCFSCGKSWPVIGTVGRRDDCSNCNADLHVCKNCAFYDKNAYNECREPSADVVLDKERANFCDFFQPGSGTKVVDKKAELLAAAEALFKKKS
jgi:hypothetical protein